MDEKLIICDFSSDDLNYFTSDDDIHIAFRLEFGLMHCNTNDSSFKKELSFKRKTESTTLLILLKNSGSSLLTFLPVDTEFDLKVICFEKTFKCRIFFNRCILH